ncbi:MAG TPA: hypothetical protein VEF55_00680 [Candidatus Binatia bacterium]|nr:hypothetical protein [Candidatus Binatia bacterium]
MRRVVFTSLLCLALAGSASASTMQRFSGAWDWRFETSAFTTDGGEGPYWLVGEGRVWEQLNAPFGDRGPWGRAHIVVEGTLSAPGQYGHLGAYSRQLRVTRVIEARALSTRESSAP